MNMRSSSGVGHATARRPPGPTVWEMLASRVDPRLDRLHFFLRCAQRYGGVVRFSDTFYLLTDAELIDDVLRHTGRDFVKYNEQAPQRILEDAIAEAAGHGSVDEAAGLDAVERRLMLPAFHHQRVAGYGGLAVGLAAEQLEGWRAGERRDVYGELARLTARVVALNLFGFDLAGDAALLIGNVETANALADRPLASLFPIATPAKRRMRSVTAALDRTVYRVIEDRRTHPAEHEDLLGLLMAARYEDGAPLSDRHLRNLIVGLLVAGYANPTATLAWALYLLSRHPEVEARVAAEVEHVLGGRLPGAADVMNLPYTATVLKETMRLYPTAWSFSRVPVEDCTLGGYHVPAGTTLGIMPWVTHRDARYFDQPHRFVPERWADGLAKRLPRGVYIPFSAGPRSCIGSSYGSLISTLLLATMLQRFRFKPAAGHKVELHASLFTLRPRHGLPMVLEAR